MVSGASAIVGGVQVAKGGGEIASGVASAPETAGASIIITAKGGIELKKGVEKLDRAWDFGKKAAHSYEQYRLDKETFEDIEGAGKAELNTKVKRVIDKIPSKLKVNGKCDEFAKKLVNGLKQEGIEYEIIRIDSKAGIYSDKAMDVIGQGYHYGVRVLPLEIKVHIKLKN